MVGKKASVVCLLLGRRLWGFDETMIWALLNKIRAFRADTGGSATVEFTLWVPAFLSIIMLTADASVLFTQQSNFWNVSQETARIVSRHALSATEGADYARKQLRFGAYVPDVVVSIDDRTQLVTVTVTGQSSAMAPFGILALTLSNHISVEVSQALEPI